MKKYYNDIYIFKHNLNFDLNIFKQSIYMYLLVYDCI